MTIVAKTCARCGQLKPLAEIALDSARKSGLHPYCKPCVLATVNAIALKHATRTEEQILQAQARLRPDGHKHCHGCHRTLPLDAFNRSRRAADGLQARCSACQKEALVRWRKKQAAARSGEDGQP